MRLCQVSQIHWGDYRVGISLHIDMEDYSYKVNNEILELNDNSNLELNEVLRFSHNLKIEFDR